ncbi:MAG: hypothetical protein R2817_14360 [Flavobacteriales bacterium]
MRRFHALLTLFMLVQAPLVLAQRDSSLTSAFARMSARERARVAREEEVAAAADPAFQALMQQGEEHFRAALYDEALASFQRARSMRPLNVHPKVKIQDLEALIARQQQAAAEPSPVEVPVPALERPTVAPSDGGPPPVIAPSPPHEEQHAGPPAGTQEPVEAHPLPVTPMPTDGRSGGPEERVVTPPPAVRANVQAAPQEEGVRIFREGRAVVEERVVQEGDRLVAWRKVVHPWGEVVHFRDNEAVPARRWQERFGGY